MDEDYKIIGNIIYTPSVNHQPDVRGIGWVYYESMLKHKDRLAQIDGLTGKEDTFHALLQRCVRTAVALRSTGVQYGDVVSVCTYNHLNSCVPHISSMLIGAKISAFDPNMSLADALYLFRIAMPKLIFVGIESVKLIEDVIREVGSKTLIVVFGPTEKHISFSEFARPNNDEQQFQPVTVKNIKDIAVIFFSSGTSGLPKGICHTHFSVQRQKSTAMQLGTAPSVLFHSDCSYWNAFLFYLNYSIQNGTTRMIYPNFDSDNPWKVFERKITTAFLNIKELKLFCKTPKPDSVDISALEMVTTAGSPLSINLVSKIKMCFPGILFRTTYGLSEVFQTVTCFDPANPKHVELMERKPNSCGLPKTGICYKFVDLETGKPLGPNERGELRVKTEAQLSGYYKMDSDDIWDEDGWLKTGDYGYYDEDCCFFIIDRVKEMFNYQFWHIVPAVIENILEKHHCVSKAVVIGKPHEVDEHHPLAIIQLNDNARITEDEIVKYLEGRVDDRQQLRGGVKFVDGFPMTSSRKINRWKLKQMVVNGEI